MVVKVFTFYAYGSKLTWNTHTCNIYFTAYPPHHSHLIREVNLRAHEIRHFIHLHCCCCCWFHQNCFPRNDGIFSSFFFSCNMHSYVLVQLKIMLEGTCFYGISTRDPTQPMMLNSITLSKHLHNKYNSITNVRIIQVQWTRLRFDDDVLDCFATHEGRNARDAISITADTTVVGIVLDCSVVTIWQE